MINKFIRLSDGAKGSFIDESYYDENCDMCINASSDIISYDMKRFLKSDFI